MFGEWRERAAVKAVSTPPQPARLALVVEDDAAIRNMLRKMLEHAGLFVVEAATGNLAIQFLADHTPDIVCLDLMLPELSGFDICAFIRKDRRFDKIPVIVISGRILPEDQAQAQELGASAYITKPFKPEVLSRWLKKLLPGMNIK